MLAAKHLEECYDKIMVNRFTLIRSVIFLVCWHWRADSAHCYKLSGGYLFSLMTTKFKRLICNSIQNCKWLMFPWQLNNVVMTS